jgi:hypothetical protein
MSAVGARFCRKENSANFGLYNMEKIFLRLAILTILHEHHRGKDVHGGTAKARQQEQEGATKGFFL